MIVPTVELTGNIHVQQWLHRTEWPKSSLLPPLMPGDPGKQLQHTVLHQTAAIPSAIGA